MKQQTTLVDEKNQSKLIYAQNLFPNSDADKKVLLQRNQHFKNSTQVQTQQTLDIFLQFRAGNEMFGIPYHYTDEIITPSRITPVPCVPTFFLGVINHYGVLMSIVDVNYFLSIDSPSPLKPMIIVVHFNHLSLGLYVDEVIGNELFDKHQLSPSITSAKMNQEFVLGIYQGKVTLLNIEKFLSDPELNVDKK